MEKVLESYLEKVSKYLKRIPVSERADIVKEIESGMCELQNNGKTSAEIILAFLYGGTICLCQFGHFLKNMICQEKRLFLFSLTMAVPMVQIV